MLEFRSFSGVTNGFRSGNELLRYEKLLFSAKRMDFAINYDGNSAKNAGSATILQFVCLWGKQPGTLYRPGWGNGSFLTILYMYSLMH